MPADDNNSMPEINEQEQDIRIEKVLIEINKILIAAEGLDTIRPSDIDEKIDSLIMLYLWKTKYK